MPSVFLSQATMDYLKGASNGQSMDATVRRLLNLDTSKGGSLVKRQVPRENLAPICAYTWTILSKFEPFADEHPELLRKDLQAQVHEFLRDGGLFEVYPDDDAPTKNGQPRWKQRFNAALAHLKKNGCVAEVEKANPHQRWSGVKYRGLEKGLGMLLDINLHMDGNPVGHAYLCSWENPSEDSLGYPLCPRSLESWEIPPELVGRKSRPTKPKEFASPVPEPSALGKFGAVLPIDEQHAALDLVFTHEDAKEEEGTNPEA